MAVSNDLNLGFLSVKGELEFQIMWTKLVWILNLSLELNYKWQIEHLSDFLIHQINHKMFLHYFAKMNITTYPAVLNFCDELIQYAFKKYHST